MINIEDDEIELPLNPDGIAEFIGAQLSRIYLDEIAPVVEIKESGQNRVVEFSLGKISLTISVINSSNLN